MSSVNEYYTHPKGANFAKLTLKNYVPWSKHLRLLLRAINAWTIVSGDEPCPNGSSADALAAILDWNNRSSNAAVVIYESCSDDIQDYLNDDMSAASMWNELAERMRPKNVGDRLVIHNSLYRCLPTPGKPITEWIARLRKLRREISVTQINDDTFVNHVYMGLPASYYSIKTIMDDQPDLTFLQETQVTHPAAKKHAHQTLPIKKKEKGGDGRVSSIIYIAGRQPLPECFPDTFHYSLTRPTLKSFILRHAESKQNIAD
ncbi:hypothetical protein BZA77DRAFT_347540 [Pyronema omphalodes]|nr:hypothetical protein BZA77DRAFT_347540 [Pyronema omphalodes]